MWEREREREKEKLKRDEEQVEKAKKEQRKKIRTNKKNPSIWCIEKVLIFLIKRTKHQKDEEPN